MTEDIYNKTITFLETTLQNKNGVYTNSRLAKSWFIKNCYENYYNTIISETSHLFNDEILTSERIYCYINKLPKRPICKCCENNTEFATIKVGYKIYCSVECRESDKKYIAEKRTNTNIKKYGSKSPCGNSVVVQKQKESIRKTIAERNEDIVQKRTKTLIEKYGVTNTTYLQKTTKAVQIRNQKQSLETLSKRTDITPLFNDTEYIKMNERVYRCNLCGNIILNRSSGHSNDQRIRCFECVPIKSSKQELSMIEFLSSLKLDHDRNNRNIIKGELDFFLPNYNLAIEMDGVFWHSENNGYRDIDRYYHFKKTEMCYDNNIQLLHIFQNEWENPQKQKIWKSIIKSKCNLNERIYARKCDIRLVNSKISNNFLDMNHLQGKCQSKYNYGLFFKNDLVALINIGQSRYNKKYKWEILRYCNKTNINVIGGFSKLLKFIKSEHFGTFVTYADMRYSMGDLYIKNNFIELKNSPPNYFYFKSPSIELYSRLQFQKHKLKDKLAVFDETKSEWENMKANGYNRIWDCGNKVFYMI